MLECEILVYHINVRIIIQMDFVVIVFRFAFTGYNPSRAGQFFFSFSFSKNLFRRFFLFSNCGGFDIIYRTDRYDFLLLKQSGEMCFF